MVIEREVLPLWLWLFPHLKGTAQWADAPGWNNLSDHLTWLAIYWEPGAILWMFFLLAMLLLAGLFISYALCAFRYGPVRAVGVVLHEFRLGVVDLVLISPRRVMALTWLSFQEALRRKALLAFIVFVVLVMFAGWYLDVKSDDPAKLYLSFVLYASNLLVLALAVLLSSFSLPNDIKNRTIYTISTKPVRPGEIVLGRMLGFIGLGTLVMALMAVIGYFFVVGGLRHSHQLDVDSLEAVALPGEPDPTVKRGRRGESTLDAHHKHVVTLDEEGNGRTDVVMGHWHAVKEDPPGSGKFVFSRPIDLFRARVPVYGRLQFYNRDGQPSEKGISVGREWSYQGYIEGGGNSAAVWTFSDITPDRYRDGLPLELKIRVFRTHKGVIDRGILGSVRLRNPKTKLESSGDTITAHEFEPAWRFIPRQLQTLDPETKTLRPIDLFEDLVEDGKVEVIIQCAERGQYYGMAAYDVWIAAPDGSFEFNYFKAFVGIWLQMIVVVSFAVMFSTVLSGVVAMLATGAVLVFGFFHETILQFTRREIEGGGSVEGMYRALTQMNVTLPIEGTKGDVMYGADSVVLTILRGVINLIPDVYWLMEPSNYVAQGYNIDWNMMAQNILTVGVLFLAISAISYFLLRSREIAA